MRRDHGACGKYGEMQRAKEIKEKLSDKFRSCNHGLKSLCKVPEHIDSALRRGNIGAVTISKE
jgi:hypothetical protein